MAASLVRMREKALESRTILCKSGLDSNREELRGKKCIFEFKPLICFIVTMNNTLDFKVNLAACNNSYPRSQIYTLTTHTHSIPLALDIDLSPSELA